MDAIEKHYTTASNDGLCELVPELIDTEFGGE